MCPHNKCPKAEIETKRDSVDVEWLVEQRLTKLLADRERYSDGFYYGLYVGLMIAIVLGVLAWPEIKKLAA